MFSFFFTKSLVFCTQIQYIISIIFSTIQKILGLFLQKNLYIREQVFTRHLATLIKSVIFINGGGSFGEKQFYF